MPNLSHKKLVAKQAPCIRHSDRSASRVIRSKNAHGKKNGYTVVAAGKGYSHIRCNYCNEHCPMRSNIGVFEEMTRFEAHQNLMDYIICCPNPDCENHNVELGTPKAYQSFGTTKSGSKRYRYKKFKTLFAVGKATRYQKMPEKNEIIFNLLMNKSPMNRICEVAGIHPPSLYNRIDFFMSSAKRFQLIRKLNLLG